MTEKNGYPDPNDIFPNEFGTTCFLKNVVKAPNIEIGDYTYYDDAAGPQHFEERNVLFNWPQFGDRLVIGKFCAIGSGTQFVMGAANHRLGSASTYPFAVFGGRWAQRVPPHMAQLPRRGDTVVGNDVWFGRMCTVMPGVKIGDGAIIAAHSVVTRDIPPYTVAGGNPARVVKQRFDSELTAILQALRWWDLPEPELRRTSCPCCASRTLPLQSGSFGAGWPRGAPHSSHDKKPLRRPLGPPRGFAVLRFKCSDM